MTARLPILSAAFDTTGVLSAPPAYRLLTEAWALAAYSPARPDPKTLPNGNGRAVLVIPALLTGDNFTNGLRAFLDACGFRSFALGAGINWGPTPHILAHLRERIAALSREYGPISLVGISMGGLLARDAAYDVPQHIAHVATFACPIALPTASNLRPLIGLLAQYYSDDVDLMRLAAPLPVPWTSIFSRKDGLIAWQSCLRADAKDQCFEVDAPHIAMARNPRALKILIERLAAK